MACVRRKEVGVGAGGENKERKGVIVGMELSRKWPRSPHSEASPGLMLEPGGDALTLYSCLLSGPTHLAAPFALS